MKCSIRIDRRAKYDNYNRYLTWTGKEKGFFETSEEPAVIFDTDNLNSIFEDLKKKYVYRITALDENGKVLRSLPSFNEPKDETKTVKQKIKGLFKFF